MIYLWALFVCSLVFLFQLVDGANSTEYVLLQSLNKYDISDITVSGVSAGGFMAVQMHVAFSSIINGTGVFAAGPFYCAEGTVTFAEHKCMDNNLGLPNVNTLLALTESDALLGFIDPVFHLKDDRVYIFSGKYDSVVKSPVVESLRAYYSAYISSANIKTEFNVPAEHCWPTLSYGENCATLSSPYIGNCDYDGAGEVLNNLYPNQLKARGQMIESNLMQFSQKPYFSDAFASIGEIGYIYVPTACKQGARCHLHVAFHGCLMYLELIGNQFPVHSGLNEWAETNNIIVLYPFVTKSSLFPFNPNGCWDWWGYTNPYYGVKTGVQMHFVRNLIKDLTGR